jgi:hypothetical protein
MPVPDANAQLGGGEFLDHVARQLSYRFRKDQACLFLFVDVRFSICVRRLIGGGAMPAGDHQDGCCQYVNGSHRSIPHAFDGGG